MDLDTTIVAVSSPSGESSHALVRVTGNNLFAPLRTLGIECKPSQATPSVVQLPIGELSILAMAYPAGRSFCGQETVEIVLSNNRHLLHVLVSELISVTNGRQAEAGEFTARAFFNGKLSLSQAEGVCATISACNDCELQGATLLREGALHKLVKPVSTSICKTLTLVESGIDFVDEEDVVAISQHDLEAAIVNMSKTLQTILHGNIAMETLRELPTVVLAGKPNAGKSSLFNALVNRNRVVVSEVVGTTRDAIVEPVRFGDKEALLIDIAGLDDASDILNTSAQEIANKTIRDANLVLECVAPGEQAQGIGKTRLVVHTKVDSTNCNSEHAISIKTMRGIDALRKRIENTLDATPTPSTDALALYPRHIRYLQDAIESLSRALSEIKVPELAAASLREALNDIGKITGEVTPDEVLGEVFSSFCIGK